MTYFCEEEVGHRLIAFLHGSLCSDLLGVEEQEVVFAGPTRASQDADHVSTRDPRTDVKEKLSTCCGFDTATHACIGLFWSYPARMPVILGFERIRVLCHMTPFLEEIAAP